MVAEKVGRHILVALVLVLTAMLFYQGVRPAAPEPQPQRVQVRFGALLRLVEDREQCLGANSAKETLRQAYHFASTLRRHATTSEEEQEWLDLAALLEAEYHHRHPQPVLP